MAGDREACIKAGCECVSHSSQLNCSLTCTFTIFSGYVSKPILVPDLVGALTDAGARVRARPAVSRSASVASMSIDLGLPGLFELELPARRSSKKSVHSASSNTSPSRSPILGPQAD